jgi:hypothetical protein
MFPPGADAASLADRLRQNDWFGQIIGPHGSGKSSLVASLIPAIEAADRRVVLYELHDGERRLPVPPRQRVRQGESTVVVVDGYEQLAPWNRLRLTRFCRRFGIGLLVTTHRDMKLPDLLTLDASLAVAQQVVERLQAAFPRRITPEDVERRFAAQQGNLREMLFDLYDLYEQRR